MRTVATNFPILVSLAAAIGVATAWWARRPRTD
jgi:hypothetical protein